MKALNLITLALVIVGGLNWGLVGAFNFDLVAFLFGVDTMLTNLVYTVVGIAAAYQIYPLVVATSRGEIMAERSGRLA